MSTPSTLCWIVLVGTILVAISWRFWWKDTISFIHHTEKWQTLRVMPGYCGGLLCIIPCPGLWYQASWCLSCQPAILLYVIYVMHLVTATASYHHPSILHRISRNGRLGMVVFISDLIKMNTERVAFSQLGNMKMHKQSRCSLIHETSSKESNLWRRKRALGMYLQFEAILPLCGGWIVRFWCNIAVIFCANNGHVCYISFDSSLMLCYSYVTFNKISVILLFRYYS